jgi:hypothetical protein
MKSNLLIPVLLVASFIACKKPKTTTPVSTSPYHFSFLLDGQDYNLKADELKYMPIQANELGGYFPANSSSFAPTPAYPVLGLKYSWPVGHKVTEADLMGLSGKYVAFSDMSVRPQIIFKPSATSFENWYSIDTGAAYYSVKLDTIRFLKQDTIAGAPLRCYKVSGTCSTVLRYDKKFSPFTNGDFDMVVMMIE